MGLFLLFSAMHKRVSPKSDKESKSGSKAPENRLKLTSETPSKIWKRPLSLEELNHRNQNSLISHLGIEFVEIGEDFLSAKMAVDFRTIQPMGILHGGASCALAETVGSVAGNYCLSEPEQVCVGLEISANHIRMVQSGFLWATAKPFHLGRKTQVWEIKICDERKRLIAISRLTLAVIEKKPAE